MCCCLRPLGAGVAIGLPRVSGDGEGLMSTATLTSRPLPGYGENVSQIVVGCRHGRTSLTIVQPRDPDAARMHDASCAKLALIKHFSEEGCCCTLELRRRFGV